MLVVFDVEGTVCDAEFWDSFQQTRGSAGEAMSGQQSFREAMAERFNRVRGMPTDEFKAAADKIKPRPEAADAVKRLKQAGFEVALASGGFDFLVERIAAELGIENHACNRITEKDGKVEGFSEPLVDAEGKAIYIKQLRRKLGLTKQETIAVGDGANDELLFAAAGAGVAFRAKPCLEAVADASFRNGLGEVVDYCLAHQANLQGKPRVLVAGNIRPTPLHDAGINAECRREMTRAELLAEIGGYDCLVYRGNERIDAEMLDAGKRLRLVCRFGVGLDHIDVAAAEARGIRVANTPTASTESVAELTIGLMLSVMRRIAAASQSTKQGEWRKNDFAGFELAGKTVGVIGVGRIGRAVARRLKPFNVKLVGYDPFLHPEDFADVGIERKATLEELLAAADVVTLHVPLKDDTHHMIDARRIAQMKDGAFLINASRGQVVDTNGLVAALRTGKLAGAGLDVFECEPLEKCGLHELDNVVMTPHVGASTFEATERIEAEVVAKLRDFEASTAHRQTQAKAVAE